MLDGSYGLPIAGEARTGDSGVCAGFWCAFRAWREFLRLPIIVWD